MTINLTLQQLQDIEDELIRNCERLSKSYADLPSILDEGREVAMLTLNAEYDHALQVRHMLGVRLEHYRKHVTVEVSCE